MYAPEHILPVQNRLGETPVWSPEGNALYWVDWGGKPTCCFEPETGKYSTFPASVPVTSLARRASGGWIAVADDGIYGWDPVTNHFTPLVGLPKPGQPEFRYNDCAVDRQGRLLVGTYNVQDAFLPEDSLYRLDIDGSLHEIDTGYATANGIGFSLDGRTVYVADQRQGQVIILDYDTERGTTSNRRVFARIPADQGLPDGLIVDAEGFVWLGHWDGGRLTRFDPGGRIDYQVRFPVQHVISCAFGGKNLDELFVTTASWDFTAADWERQPWAGDLFRVRTNARGLVEPAFEG